MANFGPITDSSPFIPPPRAHLRFLHRLTTTGSTRGTYLAPTMSAANGEDPAKAFFDRGVDLHVRASLKFDRTKPPTVGCDRQRGYFVRFSVYPKARLNAACKGGFHRGKSKQVKLGAFATKDEAEAQKFQVLHDYIMSITPTSQPAQVAKRKRKTEAQQRAERAARREAANDPEVTKRLKAAAEEKRAARVQASMAQVCKLRPRRPPPARDTGVAKRREALRRQKEKARQEKHTAERNKRVKEAQSHVQQLQQQAEALHGAYKRVNEGQSGTASRDGWTTLSDGQLQRMMNRLWVLGKITDELRGMWLDHVQRLDEVAVGCGKWPRKPTANRALDRLQKNLLAQPTNCWDHTWPSKTSAKRWWRKWATNRTLDVDARGSPAQRSW